MLFDDLENVTIESLSTINDLLSNINEWEATYYHDITSHRVKTIQEIQKYTNENVVEKQLQEAIFNNLWLLDPSWERATEDEQMEFRLSESKCFDLSERETKLRQDIKYRITGGEHIIVELKKPDVIKTLGILMDQIDKYIIGTQKILDSLNKGRESIRVIIIVGDKCFNKIKELNSTYYIRLKDANAELVTYNSLLQRTKEKYKAYMDTQKDVQSLINMIQDIEEAIIQ